MSVLPFIDGLGVVMRSKGEVWRGEVRCVDIKVGDIFDVEVREQVRLSLGLGLELDQEMIDLPIMVLRWSYFEL